MLTLLLFVVALAVILNLVVFLVGPGGPGVPREDLDHPPECPGIMDDFDDL